MSELQEYKIADEAKGTSVFFVSRSFIPAYDQALAYIDRNKGKFPMTLYQRTTKPKPSPLWEKIAEIP